MVVIAGQSLALSVINYCVNQGLDQLLLLCGRLTVLHQNLLLFVRSILWQWSISIKEAERLSGHFTDPADQLIGSMLATIFNPADVLGIYTDITCCECQPLF